MAKHHLWTSSEETYLRTHYPNHSTGAIARRLNRTLRMVFLKARQLGLKKTVAYIQDPKNRCRLFKGHTFGRAFQFRKGCVPANKGMRRPGWFAGRMRETQFRKGERSGMAAKNWVPIGTVSPDPDGYLRIKVREAAHGKEPTGFGNVRVWPLYNRWLWEQEHGPIPPKHIVAFKDGDRAHCVIENLELISMADNARRNAMWNRLPQQLVEVIVLQGALKRRIGRLSGNGKKQDRRPSKPFV